MRAIASPISLVGDDQRRQQPHDIVAGGDRQHLLGAQRVDHLGAGGTMPQAEQQALAAHLGDHRAVAILDLGEPLLEQQRHLAARRRGSRRPSITSSTALPTAIASGLPPKVEPCVPAVMPLAASLGGETGADRKAAAERLGDRHDVGRHAGMLIGEQLAGAAHAALHFVEDQQQAVLVAELAQARAGSVRHDAHAAFALHRLDQDRGRSPARSLS